MRERTRILLYSSGIMVIVAASVVALVIPPLYDTALEGQKARLEQMAQSRARFIESVARCNSKLGQAALPGGAKAATLSQITEAHKNFEGFGNTGEFTLARREGDQIVWLLSHRYQELETPRRTPFCCELAEPMRRALSGESGSLIGFDYRGATVLAAHEPIAELGWGVVAKIDMTEIRKPFLRAGFLAGGIAFLVVAAGVALMLRVTSPLVGRIEARVVKRTGELHEANKQLREEIQQRKEVEGELRRLSKVFVEATAPIIIQDLSGRIIDLNPQVSRSYGWSRDELLGHPFEKIVPPKYLAQQRDLLTRCGRGEPIQNIETARQGKSGKEIPVLLTMSLLRNEDRKAVGVLSIAEDLSKQKALERKLRHAASEAALAEDRERRTLAVDLHDGLGQLLTVLGMKLGMLRDSAPDPDFASQVREVENVLCEADGRVSSLSFQLHPPILHDMGLVVAAEWLAEDLQKRVGLNVTVEDDGTRQVLDEAVRVTLFQGLRELLLNVSRHARVGEAHVRLWKEGQFIKLEVEDEGVGFDPYAHSGGYGLFSLRERLNRLGGSVQIESVPGRGTRTVLTAPLIRAVPEATGGEA